MPARNKPAGKPRAVAAPSGAAVAASLGTIAAAPAIPRGAVDTHVHVFDPARFPFDPSTPYQPQPHECGTPADLTQVLDAHRIDRVVIVNPTSGYGYDVRCLVDALATLGPRAKGITRAPLAIDLRRLRALAAHGVVGIRLDLLAEPADVMQGGVLARLIRRVANEDMLLDIQCEGDQLVAIAPLLHQIPVRMIIDHIGRPNPERGLRQPGFAALLGLSDTGRAVVKLSGAMRCSHSAAPHPDLDSYVAALRTHYGPQRLAWGSDWPFLRSASRVDYGPLLAQLGRWFPSTADRRRILVETPAQWFGFESH
jgi:predicted TIM-barrel fold metal-dependent hydrolase